MKQILKYFQNAPPLKRMALLLLLLLLVGLPNALVTAQRQDESWTGPLRMSTDDGSVLGDGAKLVLDDYGMAHALWVENIPRNGAFALYYSRFDGEFWSEPIDVFVSGPDTTYGGFLANPILSPDGRIHLMWTANENGPILYMTAPAHDARSARNWTRERQFDLPALKVDMVLDSNNVMHVAYADLASSRPGIYYMQSTDLGLTWSSVQWLDVDIPENFVPRHVILEKDPSDDSLHIFWKYDEKIGDGVQGRDLLYTRSTDGGKQWSRPFHVDIADESPGELRAGGMLMLVNRGTVHLIWSGDDAVHRQHRFSVDGGVSWSQSQRIFGNLNGSAGDALVLDQANRMYFYGQIRYPQALYEIQWLDDHWEIPTIVYLIARDPFEPFDGRIHVHAVDATILSGNLMLTTFTGSPTDDQRALYSMYKVLEDVPKSDDQPTPTRIAATAEATAVPETAASEATPTALPFANDVPGEDAETGINLGPSMLAVGGLLIFVMAIAWVRRR
jgi:hypothetical protein